MSRVESEKRNSESEKQDRRDAEIAEKTTMQRAPANCNRGWERSSAGALKGTRNKSEERQSSSNKREGEKS